MMTWDKPQRRPRQPKRCARREAIYDYIIEYANTLDGPTPSIREVALALGIDYKVTYYHVIKLCAEGRLRQERGKLIVVGSEWIGPGV
jgi:hypothetical protein